MFILHNETLNVWSHLLGSLLYLALAIYVLLWLQPPSLHETPGLISRWTADFEPGRFDQLHCDSPSFEPLTDQCPYKTSELLDDLLETEGLLEWHATVGRQTPPTMAHTNLNYHASAFEKVD